MVWSRPEGLVVGIPGYDAGGLHGQLVGDLRDELLRLRVYAWLGLDQQHEREPAVGVSVLLLAIGEAGEAAVVPPVGRAQIAAEPFGKAARDGGRKTAREDLAVIQPCLEVPGRGLDDDRRMESLRFHSADGIGGEVVHEAQAVLSLRTNVDVPPRRVLVTEPRDRPEQGLAIPHPG